jgi:hypothetical protein
MQFSTLKSARLASLFGFFTALTLGCVVTIGDGGKPGGECPEINNHLEGDKCYCDDGYSWCDALDDSDLTCCLDSNDTSNPTNNPSNDNTSNNDTTSDVPTGGTDTSNSDGTTTETPPTTGTTGPNPTDCVIETELPGSCDVDMGEAYLCLQASDPACDVEGSKYYICEGGVWVEDTSSGDESCKFDLDNDGAFSYGCRLDGNTIQFECGVGPGTPCDSNSDSTCTTDSEIEYCVFGKTTTADCLFQCQTVGDDDMVTYDHGYCGEQDSSNVCICCDEGDDGCPINEGTTTSTSDGTSTGGESSTG